MADVVDMASEIEAEHLASALRRAATVIPAGAPGICDNCGEDMPRLVDGLCGYCRDGRRPPLNHSPAPRLARPAPDKESEPMPGKTISLPASETAAIAAVEARAKQLDSTIWLAASDLIVAGAQTINGENAPPVSPVEGIDPATLPPIAQMMLEHDFSIDALFAALLGRINAPDLSAELAAMTARAEQAEAKLACLKDLIA